MPQILYADDDDLFRDMVASVLEGAGHHVRLATNGNQAIEEVRQSAPDLIILDYRMGDPDGFAVCRELKNDPRYGHLPILILTAEGTIEDRLGGFDAGADDYLAKPFDGRELSARVGALLELSRRGKDRNPSTGLPGGGAIHRELERRLNGDSDFAVCYLDLDNFKPFGERFGFAVSDAIIADVGALLSEAAHDEGTFAGHVGGDDFILICAQEGARDRVEQIQLLLASKVRSHVPADVATAGVYTGKDRSGVVKEFPLTSISAAILKVPAKHPVTLEAMGEKVSEVKDQAKRQGAGGIVEVNLAGLGSD